MRITLFNKTKLTFLDLPQNKMGSYWLVDDLADNENLISIDAVNGFWVAKSNKNVHLMYNDIYYSEIKLELHKIYTLENKFGEKYIFYTDTLFDNTFNKYLTSNSDLYLTIGNDIRVCNICYNIEYISKQYAVLKYTEKKWSLSAIDDIYIFRNNSLIINRDIDLDYGDVIFIFGLKILVLYDMIVVNNPNNLLSLNCNSISNFIIDNRFISGPSNNKNKLYEDNDYFYGIPRIRKYIETYELKFAPPPAKSILEDRPFLLVIGPMLTMGIISVVSFTNVFIRIKTGKAELSNTWTTLVTSSAMLLTTILWPNITRIYTKKRNEYKEKRRISKYNKYIEVKKGEIQEQVVEQRNILYANYPTQKECYNIVLNKSANLWERKISQKDFLTVRIGTGEVSLDIRIDFNEDEFSIEEDELKDYAEEVVNDAKILKNVPIGYSFFNRNVSAIIGNIFDTREFIKQILLQLIAFHSYDNLKIVFITNKTNENVWKKYKSIPHCFSNVKDIRFFASESEEIKNVLLYLEREYVSRITPEQNHNIVQNENGMVTYAPYYLIITDDYQKIRKSDFVNLLLENSGNFGFSLLISTNSLGKLPSECTQFINVNKNGISTLISNDPGQYKEIKFMMDPSIDIKYDKLINSLANIPIEMEEDAKKLPDTLGFLEMYNVSKIEQLNIINRWRLNDPTKSLWSLVGINTQGDKVYLDLHEKAHGPHGLIAGMTGSGKSEFIITYILSMAINYSPEEVSFILIDYKGGGLALAFENKNLGIKLPHIAGVITNLDKAELNRTLVSIDSELRRRQIVFNEARNILGESTIDIYKYQKFYREGKLKEAIPHLFIICDEFAELKSQQPDFMDDLISAARIGRSLGIHLILATQKPNGVVNDQIWSNSKFRVCLKVQEKADSNEMIKRPDAASLKNPGRFYLQVGYDELFILGQSGWSGTRYRASDYVIKEEDKSVDFIDNIGNKIKSVQNDIGDANTQNKNLGDELTNIVKYLSNLAVINNISSKQLWLDKIPENIYVDDLIKKYNFKSDNICAIIGEYDDPLNQKQGLLKLEFNSDSNTIVYGASMDSRELFLSSIIYSLCTNYSPELINIYILDFGSEIFNLYNKFPQVSDIVTSQEEEKINRLFNLIDEEIEKRKKILSENYGDFVSYNKMQENKIPLKLIMINNYESFRENYPKYVDSVIKYSRDGARNGIIFIITTNTRNGLFTRFVKNFTNKFTLDMPDRSDYVEILGKIGNLYPTDCIGRGMFRNENVYEFQTAKITNNSILDFLENKIKEVNEKYPQKAPRIPVLPDNITIESLKEDVKDKYSIVLGIKKQTLSSYTHNLVKNKGYIISAQSIEYTKDLINSIVTQTKDMNNIVTCILDVENDLSYLSKKVNTYYNDNYLESLKALNSFTDDKLKNTELKLLLIIYGVEKLNNLIDNKELQELSKYYKLSPNINLIFVDSDFKLKKIIFEKWYTDLVNNTNGIWIGNGLVEQGIIKISGYIKNYSESINNEFAWVIKNGVPSLVKLINNVGDSNER